MFMFLVFTTVLLVQRYVSQNTVPVYSEREGNCYGNYSFWTVNYNIIMLIEKKLASFISIG